MIVIDDSKQPWITHVEKIWFLLYFLIDNAHLKYNAHPKLFRHSFWCIDNMHDAN